MGTHTSLLLVKRPLSTRLRDWGIDLDGRSDVGSENTTEVCRA